ncbi:MAG: hypothetical protein AAFY73_11615 [Pseudomonadota bacterium]
MDEKHAPIFAALRELYCTHEADCVVLNDEPDRYHLGTHEVRQKDGYRTELGGVHARKSYVSAYLMPVYIHPDLLDDISPDLKNRMQGKSCFNFKKMDETLLAEFGALVQRGVTRFRDEGRFTPRD